MKKSIYIFGPIHLFGANYLPVYKKLNKVAAKYFKRVIGTYPDFWNTKETDRTFYNRTYHTITKCDLFLAEISSPSMGVGMELQMGQEHGIPSIGLCKKGAKASKMITGIPCMKKIIYYKDLNDLAAKVEEELASWISK